MFLAVSALVVRRIWFTNSTTAVPVEEAVDRYRSETTLPLETTGAPTSTAATATTPAEEVPVTTAEEPVAESPEPELPDAGVYRYLTSGGESIDEPVSGPSCSSGEEA